MHESYTGFAPFGAPATPWLPASHENLSPNFGFLQDRCLSLALHTSLFSRFFASFSRGATRDSLFLLLLLLRGSGDGGSFVTTRRKFLFLVELAEYLLSKTLWLTKRGWQKNESIWEIIYLFEKHWDENALHVQSNDE